jgi:hypothetical protein
MRAWLSPMQWCCLFDAEAGRLVAVCTQAQQLWTHTADDAVCHSLSVVRELERLGWLRRVAAGRYVRTPETASALWIPVRQPPPRRPRHSPLGLRATRRRPDGRHGAAPL